MVLIDEVTLEALKKQAHKGDLYDSLFMGAEQQQDDIPGVSHVPNDDKGKGKEIMWKDILADEELPTWGFPLINEVHDLIPSVFETGESSLQGGADAIGKMYWDFN
ncbi:hypothetical protein ACET3Z_024340 [Daucus carota]